VDREDITKIVRLGRRGEDDGHPRPILVHLVSRIPKNLIMENLYKLRSAEDKYKQVVVAHDMTKNERNECREMVEEAKARTSQEPSGEWAFVVRGRPGQMKILKVKKTHR
jgi:16S rRNA C1402 (ribose-2'-O) methylase RsmI